MASPSSKILLRNAGAFADAERRWNALQSDPRLAAIKHFRDKQTAHLADPIPGINPPKWGELLDFSKEVAITMEQFALGVGATAELLSDTADWRLQSAEKFWGPWESFRTARRP
jgi:hypothetical protein